VYALTVPETSPAPYQLAARLITTKKSIEVVALAIVILILEDEITQVETEPHKVPVGPVVPCTIWQLASAPKAWEPKVYSKTDSGQMVAGDWNEGLK
jgi:hypothetical protein